jgi:uncharacterized Zn-binding protein involved in type VI secretion
MRFQRYREHRLPPKTPDLRKGDTRMRKPLLVQGSPTTTGGLVIGGSATTMTDNGKPFAVHGAVYGDEATCGNTETCKGTFRVVGTATRRMYRGRAGVIEGDLVACTSPRSQLWHVGSKGVGAACVPQLTWN